MVAGAGESKGGFAHDGNLFSIDPGKGCGRARVRAAKCLNILATALGTTLAPCAVFDNAAPPWRRRDRMPLRTAVNSTMPSAVRVAGVGFSGGKYRKLDEPGLSRAAADKAYKMAGLGPQDIDVAEVHDATSFCEIYQCEMLRFCPEGEGGKFIESGATGPGGKLPVNTSGGLVSKGHPVGATGLSMLAELAIQLRGEAGPRQVKGAEIALAENGGGVIGMEEAVTAVVILQRG